MRKYLIFLLFLGMSSSLVAQTLKETVRGKYGENLGTAETTIRGGKSVTVYKDKYGQVTGTSESKTSAFGKTTTVYKDKYGQKTGTSTSTTSHGLFSSGTTTTTYRDKYGQKTGTSTTKHSGNSGTTVYRDKYGQVTRKGTVKGRLPKKGSGYSYGWSSSRSRGK